MTTLLKDNILERLLVNNQLTIEMVDLILNNKEGKIDLISDLLHNCIITNREALVLLKDNETPQFSFGIPNQTTTYGPPVTLPYIDWSPHGTSPHPLRPYTITSTNPVKSTDSSALNINFTSK